jgi:sulfate permease, SulP family
MKSLCPILLWLPNYQRDWLRADVIAGVTLAAYLIPAALGDASLAGLPPEAGLYSCLFAGLVFWLFCSSRQTAITVTSAISLLVGASLGQLADGDAARFGALAAGNAILVGVLFFLGWLASAGEIVNFVSETVLLGFKSGIALFLTMTQLPKLCGFKGAHGDFWERTWHFISHLHETNAASLGIGVCALTALVIGKRYLKHKPIALLVVIAGVAIASVTDLASHRVALLGEVPQGLPPIGLPAVNASDLNELLPLAMACFLLGAVETAAIGRMFARKNGYRLDPNQEFLALAGANLAAGLGQGLPVSGGMSQSLVNETGGAKTPLSSFVAALIMLLVALFFSGMLRNLPQPVLAAIVLTAVGGLFKLSSLQRLWQFSQAEFGIAIVALLGVLGSGILRGVLIGSVLSLLLLLRRGSRPHTTELGRVLGTDYFADRVRHPENERIAGVFVFRCEGPLLFFNSDYVRDRFFELLAQREENIELAIFFLGATPVIDMAGAELLMDLHKNLEDRGIAFELAEAHGAVRDTLKRAGYVTDHADVEANETVADLIKRRRKSATPMPQSPAGSLVT